MIRAGPTPDAAVMLASDAGLEQGRQTVATKTTARTIPNRPLTYSRVSQIPHAIYPT
jgi:hypothetical protein